VKHVGAWLSDGGWRASISPDMYPVDMRLEGVTEETVGSDTPGLWLSSWAAHLAEWDQGLRWSSRLRHSNRGGLVDN
jgi:hypothetical protein